MIGVSILIFFVTFFQFSVSTPIINQRIYNGVTASSEEVPYQAVVKTSFPASPISKLCGGALISDRHVLTAAHCLEDEDHNIYQPLKVKVYLGSNIRLMGLQFETKWFVKHEDWDKSEGLVGDIALLVLSEPVDISDKIKPIPLPSAYSTNEQIEGSTALVTGHGETERSGSSIVLKAVNVTIAKKSICDSFEIPDDYICVKIDHDNHKTDCSGDNGGPVVINDTLYGIVSYGPLDCSLSEFSAYTSVVKYRDWILGKMF